LGRKNRTVADSSRGNISYKNDLETNSRSEHIALTVTNPLRNPAAEAVRNFMAVEKTYAQLSPLINANTFLTDIGIAKPIGFSGICDLCLSGQIEAIWNFVEGGSLTKVIHACDAEVVMRIEQLAEDKRKALQCASFRCLADVVNYWIGHGDVYLKAEELLPTESYDFVTDAERPPPYGDSIGLDLIEADRAVKENKKKSMATGVVTINKDELLDFLSKARATFGIFRVKMVEGRTCDFFMYIVRELESCKFSHLKGLQAKNRDINNCDHASQQTDLNKAIQFVDGGSIFRWDKLDSMYKNKLSVQIHELSKNLGAYCYW